MIRDVAGQYNVLQKGTKPILWCLIGVEFEFVGGVYAGKGFYRVAFLLASGLVLSGLKYFFKGCLKSGWLQEVVC